MKRVIISLSIALLLIIMAVGAVSCKKNENSNERTDLAINTTSVRILVGDSFKIHATNRDGSLITFESSDEEIATVSMEGLVSTKKIGTAYITVESGNESCVCEVEVYKNIYQIEIMLEGVQVDDELNLKNSAKVELLAKIYRNGVEINGIAKWNFNGDCCEITVLDNGRLRISAKSIGSTIIRALYEDEEAILTVNVI